MRPHPEADLRRPHPWAAAVVGSPAAQVPVSHSDRVPVLAWVIAAVFVAVELALSDRYGFLQDELYFIVAGHHLAFGYVDQPPIGPLLTRITGILGVSPTAIRIIPALAGGAIVVMTARLAALFGAGRFGRVLAAFIMACAPVLLGAVHIGNTTPLDLLAWTAVLLCVTTALLRHRPRWWLAAGVVAGLGLEADNLVVLLLICLTVGLLASMQRPVLWTTWPWLGAGIAAVIWAPNLIWQATHGWPQLAMSAVLHQQNTAPADYAGALPAQLIYLGLLVAPLIVAGFVVLWRTPELRFLAITASLVLVYVLAWVPGKVYYADGVAPAVLAAGALAAERWIARARRPRGRRWLIVAASFVGVVVALPSVLPILPVGDVHDLPASSQQSSLGDTIGWPQLTERGGGAGRGPGAGRPAAHLNLHWSLRRSRRARRPRLSRPPATRAVRPQHLLDVGSGPRLRPNRARGRRARPAAAVLRQLPPAHHLPRPLPHEQRLD